MFAQRKFGSQSVLLTICSGLLQQEGFALAIFSDLGAGKSLVSRIDRGR